MSAKCRLTQRLAATIAIGIAFGWSAIVYGGAPGGKGTPKGPTPLEPAKKTTQTRVFTPKHTDPAEVLQAIEMLLESVANLEHLPMAQGGGGLSGLPGGLPGAPGAQPGPGVPGVQPGAGALGGVPGSGPGPGGAGLGGLQGGIGGAGLGGFAGLQGGIGGAGLGGLGGMMGMMGAGPPVQPAARLALDKRTGSVIVRGQEKEVQIATDLFKLLDNPPGKPLPEVKSLRAFQLKHAQASNIANLATGELDIGAALLPLDEAKLLVAVGPPDAVRDVIELVNSLDTPEQQRPNNEKRKKLFSPDQLRSKEAAAE